MIAAFLAVLFQLSIGSRFCNYFEQLPAIANIVCSYPRFFVASAGSDSNPGTQALPWKTVAHVNAQSFETHTTVSFNGGDSFSGGMVLTTSVTPGPITINSYGSGQATIRSGNSAACVTATDIPGVTIHNIICTGGGSASSATGGILVINSQARNTKLAGPTITNSMISDYGGDGINVEGKNGSSGFSGTTISNNTVHDVTGNVSTTGILACVVLGGANYGSGASAPSNVSFTISGNTIFGCVGNAASTGITGVGILVGESANGVVTKNVVHDSGDNSTATSTGPAGIIVYDGNLITVSFNEVYNMRHGNGGKEGNGIHISAGLTNSSVVYNWSHDNNSHNLHIATFFDGTCCITWGDNIVAFNITQDAKTNGEVGFYFAQPTTGPVYVFNNTLINNLAQGGIEESGIGDTATWTGTIANNIVILTGGGNLVYMTNANALAHFLGNDYYTYGQATNYSWLGTTYTSFAGWQGATGQEKLGGSNIGLISDPKIYVPGGGVINGGYVAANLKAYNLQASSPMAGAGLNLQTRFGVDPGTHDYYGTSISASSLPVGAVKGDFGSLAASCTAASQFFAWVSSFITLDSVNFNSLFCGEGSNGDSRKIDVK